MNYLRNICLGAAFAVALGAQSVSAGSVTIQSPAQGAVVGRTFTLSGTATPNAGMGVLIDGQVYVPPNERGRVAGHGGGTGHADARGNFSITLDLNGNRVTNDLSGSEIQSRSLADGPHTLVVEEYFFNGQMGTPGSARVKVTVQSPSSNAAQSTPAQSAAAQAAVTPAASPTVTTTSTPNTQSAIAGAHGSSSRELSPMLALIGLTALGMLAVAVAHRYSPRR